MRKLFWVLPLFSIAACAPSDELGSGEGPILPLVSSAGASAGAVQVDQTASGTYLRIAAEGLPPGDHGVHLHAVGRCDPPGFQTAGAHWNPAGRQHGHLNPRGSHAGDLPNLTVSANGHGTLNFLAGNHSLQDADGTSLVIHAKPDDYRTDPSGNSGDRIACVVLAAPTQP